MWSSCAYDSGVMGVPRFVLTSRYEALCSSLGDLNVLAITICFSEARSMKCFLLGCGVGGWSGVPSRCLSPNPKMCGPTTCCSSVLLA